MILFLLCSIYHEKALLLKPEARYSKHDETKNSLSFIHTIHTTLILSFSWELLVR